MFSKKVVFIVEGEVAYAIPAIFPDNDPAIDKFNAVFSSNPTVMVTEPDVEVGHLWNGDSFSLPSE